MLLCDFCLREKDASEIYRLAGTGDAQAILRYITRNWKYDRKQGDGLKFGSIMRGGRT